MARNNYQYGTNPRKIQTEYNPKRKKTKSKKIEKRDGNSKIDNIKQKKIALKNQKRKHHKNIALILAMFLILLAVSYRSSLITEKFNEIQNKKVELAKIEKTNGQLEVGIEENLNLSNIEKEAQKELGMQKMSNDQKKYISLNNKDYTESAKNEIVIEENITWYQKIINKIFGK